MKRCVVLLVAALAIPHLTGCGGKTPTPSTSGDDPAEKPLRARIIGKWTTSTAPELQASATTISFLETGEYQSSGLVIVQGQLLTVEKDGKKEPLRVPASGAWDLEGEEIHVRVTEAGLHGKFEPFTYRVLSADEKRLVLDKGGERIALFRME